MREQLAIPEEQLRACLQDQYDIFPITLEFLPRGKDYSAGVYRVVSEQSTAYLLKATSRPLYEPRCHVPRYLNAQGITSVVAPIPTKSGALWTILGDWTVIVYLFIDGESSITGMTNAQWEEVGTIFKQIHSVTLPSVGFESLQKETFDPTKYTQWIRTFEAQHLHSLQDDNDSSRALRTHWIEHQAMLHTGVTTLETLASRLQRQSGPYVICHADLHAANLLRDPAGRVFVIDWDEVMLAPKERDFIFVREPQADAFWQGYGQRTIDWVALTYYLWERIIQDVIQCAQDLCFRDDLGEETRTDIAQLLHLIFAEEGGTIAAAYEASTRIST